MDSTPRNRGYNPLEIGDSPHGINCVVDFQLRGLREESDRIANIRTAWELTGPGEVPRLVSAYPKN